MAADSVAIVSDNAVLQNAVVRAGVADWGLLANYEAEELTADLSLDPNDLDLGLDLERMLSAAKLLEKGIVANAARSASTLVHPQAPSLTVPMLGRLTSEPFHKSA